jgi:zinc transport system ATP-binding protein
VLDEPSTGVDIVGEAAFYDVIVHLKETHGTTILMVSHDLSVLSSMVDTVVCLNGKMICAGPPRQVLTTESMNALFGEHTKLYEHLHEAHHASHEHHPPHHHQKT